MELLFHQLIIFFIGLSIATMLQKLLKLNVGILSEILGKMESCFDRVKGLLSNLLQIRLFIAIKID